MPSYHEKFFFVLGCACAQQVIFFFFALTGCGPPTLPGYSHAHCTCWSASVLLLLSLASQIFCGLASAFGLFCILVLDGQCTVGAWHAARSWCACCLGEPRARGSVMNLLWISPFYSFPKLPRVFIFPPRGILQLYRSAILSCWSLWYCQPYCGFLPSLIWFASFCLHWARCSLSVRAQKKKKNRSVLDWELSCWVTSVVWIHLERAVWFFFFCCMADPSVQHSAEFEKPMDSCHTMSSMDCQL